MKILNTAIFAAFLLAIGCSTCQQTGEESANANKPGEARPAAPTPIDPSERNKGIHVPDGGIEPQVNIVDLNYWYENQQFTIVGYCENHATNWQRLFLKVSFTDAQGKPLQVNDQPICYIPVASGVVPPSGRSAFSWTWDAFVFSGGTPAKCEVSGAAAFPVSAGVQLVALDPNAVQAMAVQNVPLSDTTQKAKPIGTQVSCTVYNPFEQEAKRPMTQVVLWGKDKKIWWAAVAPVDSSDVVIVSEHAGPMKAKEKRKVGTGVLHSAMPQGFQNAGFWKVEFLPFDLRL